MIYVLNPRNYAKHTNYMMQNKILKITQEKIYKPKFKTFKLTGKKKLLFSNNQINFVKNQKKIYVFYHCVISPS